MALRVGPSRKGIGPRGSVALLLQVVALFLLGKSPVLASFLGQLQQATAGRRLRSVFSPSTLLGGFGDDSRSSRSFIGTWPRVLSCVGSEVVGYGNRKTER